MTELFKMSDKQYVIKHKGKSYPAKNIETIFVYLTVFNVKFQVIEDTVIKLEIDNFNFARFEKGHAVLEKR